MSPHTGPPEVPAKPEPPVLVTHTGGWVELLLQAPFNDGGRRVSSFYVHVLDVASNQELVYQAQRVPGPEVTKYKVYNLIISTEYTFSYRAANVEGPGIQSDALSHKTKSVGTYPEFPYIDVVVATGGAITIHVRPWARGGLNVTSYNFPPFAFCFKRALFETALTCGVAPLL
jgi:hypothetical protein